MAHPAGGRAGGGSLHDRRRRRDALRSGDGRRRARVARRARNANSKNCTYKVLKSIYSSAAAPPARRYMQSRYSRIACANMHACRATVYCILRRSHSRRPRSPPQHARTRRAQPLPPPPSAGRPHDRYPRSSPVRSSTRAAGLAWSTPVAAPRVWCSCMHCSYHTARPKAPPLGAPCACTRAPTYARTPRTWAVARAVYRAHRDAVFAPPAE